VSVRFDFLGCSFWYEFHFIYPIRFIFPLSG
jgi:hypothetical protein